MAKKKLRILNPGAANALKAGGQDKKDKDIELFAGDIVEVDEAIAANLLEMGAAEESKEKVGRWQDPVDPAGLEPPAPGGAEISEDA